MSSACINNAALPIESFPPAHQYIPAPSAASTTELCRSSSDMVDFEFRLDDQVTMLPADELFSDGKLVPLQLATLRAPAEEIHSMDASDEKQWCGTDESGIRSSDLTFSPKAPRCTTRWRDLLSFKKQQNPNKTFLDQSKPRSIEPIAPRSRSPGGKSIRNLLIRQSKSSIDPSLSLPLLHDIDPESVTSSISTRLSLSSSSSGLDHEDPPRLSFDSDKVRNPLRVRISKPRPTVSDERFRARVNRSPTRQSTPTRGVSVDSPRMDPSGRIIFHGLERSSSSPGSFNVRSRAKYRGMERSLSAHVRAPSVLNVPVYSLRGSSKHVSVFRFGQLFSQARKERVGSSSPSPAAAMVSTRVAKVAGEVRKKAQTERETEQSPREIIGV